MTCPRRVGALSSRTMSFRIDVSWPGRSNQFRRRSRASAAVLEFVRHRNLRPEQASHPTGPLRSWLRSFRARVKTGHGDALYQDAQSFSDIDEWSSYPVEINRAASQERASFHCRRHLCAAKQPPCGLLDLATDRPTVRHQRRTIRDGAGGYHQYETNQ